jgi:hypothetical protein
MDGCKDSELVCTKCQSVKNTIPATCCWFWETFIFRLYFLSLLKMPRIC